MPKIKNVEKKIWEVEGFGVTFKHSSGADVRGDKNGIPQYDYERQAKNDSTVSEWKTSRFKKCYPGYDVDVLNGDGEVVNGNTKLGTVRDSYEDD
ncbi:hypothetical protein J31TS6_22600 [Brevibacillus reuszeri]|uniref:hypothetical protein n=1 Tax=Brevibacillus reuszeri TaxID=54915 RepID=UPI001B2519F7|nr:hypothetical protein [Brevibacillus reuszeri]GIO06232.1 hypothetical protein J31TS6_22600 [Brevibacillus reuszeri]